MNLDIYNRFIELEDKVKELEIRLRLSEGFPSCPERPVNLFREQYIPIPDTRTPYPYWQGPYCGYTTGI